MRLAELSILFMDENQIVRPGEIGNVRRIKDAATRFGVCAGNTDAYLQWSDKVLGIVRPANLGGIPGHVR